jgi:ADP-heptose:LPS heptosyltransferase
MLGGLGDMLCAVPALRALRAALPKARITLVGLSSARTFVARFSHYVDELAECPGYPGIPETKANPLKLPQFFTAMHEQKLDVAIQLHGNGIVTNPFTVLLGARRNAGFFIPGHYCPDEEGFLEYPEKEPEVLRQLRLMEFLDVESTGEALEFPLWRDDREALAALPEARDLWPRGYACLHPGANDPSRTWPVDRFALVADALCDLGMPIILTGNAGERDLTRRVAGAMKNRPVDLAGRTSLGALAVLLSNARLLVCNDTGVSHVADALRVPSVVIFTNSDPDRWAPLDRCLHRPVGPRPWHAPGRFFNDQRGRKDDAATDGGCREVAHKPVPDVEEVIIEAENLLREKADWRRE